MKLLLLTGLFLFTANAQALTVELSVAPKSVKCNEVKGLIAGDSVVLKATPVGGSRVQYVFSMTLEGLQKGPSDTGFETRESKPSTKNTHEFVIPQLESQLPWTMVNFSVSAKDRNGVAFETIQIPVTRRFILTEINKAEACRQVYTPRPLTGLMYNQNDSDQTLMISQNIQTIQEERDEKSKGWSFAPTIFNGGFGISLFSVSKNYLKSTARQISRSFEIQVSNNLNPGDVGFGYVQYTRIKIPFAVTQVDQCGNQTEGAEAYLDQWLASFNLIKVDPRYLDNSKLKPGETPYFNQSYGEPVMNSCQPYDALTKVQI